jgi:hypothetical protein
MGLSKVKILFYSYLIFLLFFCIGLTEAAKSPFWVDETQYLNNLSHPSWGEIFTGRYHIDNSHFPLYICMERSYSAFLSSFGLKWPNPQGDESIGLYENFKFQIYQRIPSVLFFSLVAAISFYYLSFFFSPWVGISNLLLMFGSEQVWSYIWQARPYSLWYFLSAMQLLFLLLIIFDKKKDHRSLLTLGILNILLSLLNGFVIYQVFVSIVLIFIFGPRHRWFFLMSILALGLWAFYFYQNFMLSGKINFVFTSRGSPFNLIKANFPLERLLFLFAFIGIAIYQRCYRSCKIKPEMALAGLCVFLLFGAGQMLYKFAQMNGFVDGSSLEVPNRYFIFLAPASVYATSIFGWKIYEYLQPSRRFQKTFVWFFVGIILVRVLITYKKIFFIG